MYTPLYIKTHYSLLSSLIKIDELIDFATKNNLFALSITDNNMYGTMEFYKACKKSNIKPIIGLELTLDGYIIVLYAMNYNGYKNLLKINTLMNESELSISNIMTLISDLICIVPYQSLKIYDNLTKLFKYIFKGYQNDYEKNEIIGDNKVYFNETLYIFKNEKNYLKYLYGIRDGISFTDVSIDKKDNYIHNQNELDDLKNNYLITELCNLDIEFHNDLLPIYECPDNMDSYTYLKKLCKEGMRNRFGDTVPVIYIERLKYELNIINSMGFCNYFLIVWDYVMYAKNNSILVGPGRGSAAGSLVSYLLNITSVDPIKYNLLFERFLNPERISMPDIDIDFEFDRREEVINYCINKYGNKKVAPIITFGSLGAKQVIRDVARTMDISLEVVDKLSKMINSRFSLYDNYNNSLKIRNYVSNNEELTNLYRIASKFEGMKRHTSIHAAGIVMANIDLDEVIPLDKKHENFYTTSFSMEYLEEIGLLKMDFLGLKNLSLITTVIKDIKEKEGINIDFDSIPLDDPKTLSLFTNVLTIGIFQFESSGMINFLNKLKPTTFEDIASANALFRPGPMGNIDSYVKRKHGKEKIDYFHPDLEKILKPTYGIIVYQEQIMQIVSVMAGYSMGEADVLRRAMSKKKEDVLLKEKDKFVTRSVELGYNENLAIEIYNLILKFAQYGFPRAHSVAYAFIAYKMAYLKVNYPKYFMQSLLNLEKDSEVKIREYINECKKMGIKILEPSINESTYLYTVTENGIRFPLSGIKGIGYNAVSTIEIIRNEDSFKDIFDFVRRTYDKNINKKMIESLILTGCFEYFGINNRTLIENLDAIINYAELTKDIGLEFTPKPVIKEFPPYSIKEQLDYEQKLMGVYLSNHPVINIRLKYSNAIPIKHLPNFFDKQVNIIVYIESIKEIKTKKNEIMCFVKGSDEEGIINITLFPVIYNNYDLKTGDIILVNGKVEKRFDKFQVVANSIEILL